MEKTIKIDGKDVKFKASAATIRNYRLLFGRDLLIDFQALLNDASKGGSLSPESLNTFENFAFVMAKQADPSLPDTPDDWLDTFGMFSIYNILPQLVELWTASSAPTSTSKKKA